MTFSGKKILVTGATGFVGRRLMQALAMAGHQPTACTRTDASGKLELPGALAAFEQERFDQVIHLAACTFVPKSWQDPEIFYRVNSHGTTQVLDYCRKTRAGLIYISSYIYGVPQVLPISESHPAAPNTPYNHSKWLAEESCRFYQRELGVPVTILRPFNIFGPGQNSAFLLPSLVEQARTGTITVQDLAPRRDYLHVDDLIDAIIAALHKNDGYALYNVGSGQSYSVLELLALVQQACPKKITWQETGNRRNNEIPDTVADIRLIRQKLSWAPKRTLAEFFKEELS